MKPIRKEDKNSNLYLKNFKTVGKLDEGQIVCTMADNSHPRYTFIKENEIKLLETLFNQHEENKKELSTLKDKHFKHQNRTWMFGVSALLVTASSVLSGIAPSLMTSFDMIHIPFIISSGVLIIGTVYEEVKTLSTAFKINEIQKEDYLLNNKEILNEVDIENSNHFEKVSHSDKETIASIIRKKERTLPQEQEESEIEVFDLNNIDKLSLSTLKRLKANITREDYLGLQIEEHEKGNARTYRK